MFHRAAIIVTLFFITIGCVVGGYSSRAEADGAIKDLGAAIKRLKADVAMPMDEDVIKGIETYVREDWKQYFYPIALMEASGYPCSPVPGPNPYNCYGLTQVQASPGHITACGFKSLSEFHTAIDGPIGRAGKAWTRTARLSCDRSTIKTALQCGQIVFEETSKKCTGWGAKICSYEGPCWCNQSKCGVKDDGGAKGYPGSLTAPCPYANAVCSVFGVDCTTGEGAEAMRATLARGGAIKGDISVYAVHTDDSSKVGTDYPNKINGKKAVYTDKPLGRSCVNSGSLQSLHNHRFTSIYGNEAVRGLVKVKDDALQNVISRSPAQDVIKCLRIKLQIFDIIQKLIEGVNAIAIAVGLLLQQIMNWVCDYVATTINNLLSFLCIPLPDLSLNFGLPSLEKKYCNGIQLITATSGAMSLPEDLDRLKYFDVRRHMSNDLLQGINKLK